MMKILMPLAAFETKESSESGINSKVVTGGIEKFSQNLYTSVPGIIPVEITKEDRKNRRTRKIVEAAVTKHLPDIIFINNPWHYNMVRRFNLPVICVFHEPLIRDVRFIEVGNIFRNMKEDGCHLYFVSEGQFEYHKALAKRIQDYDISIEDVSGFVDSSFCEDMPYSFDDKEWDCSTVGRCEPDKHPFYVHKKLTKTDKKSLVMSNEVVYNSDKLNKYATNNKGWECPQCTKWSLPHDEVLKHISKSKVFVSTWSKESWGITAMEALGCGVPVILLTDKNGVHCSESLAVDESHFIKLDRKSTTVDEFDKAVEKLSNYSPEKRQEIYDETNKKHSKERWVGQFMKMIEKRMKDTSVKSTLEAFL